MLREIEPVIDALEQLPQQCRAKLASDPYLAIAAYLWSRDRRARLELSLNYPGGYGYRCAETLPQAHQVLINMAHAGYLQQELAEAGHPCPACGSLHILLRDTCVECSSINIREETLLHHFSCSFQGKETSFLDANGNYHCPKCRKPLRHLGMDYDKPGGVFVCRGCEHHSSETQIRGRCLACDHGFAVEQSPRKELYDYVLNDVGIHALFQGKFTATVLEDILQPTSGLVSPEVLAMMTNKFAALERRHGVPSIVLKASFNSTAGESLEQRIKLITAIGQELARLRTTDSVAYHMGQLLILLPGCDNQGVTRISNDFKTIVSEIFGTDTAEALCFSHHSVQDPLPLAA